MTHSIDAPFPPPATAGATSPTSSTQPTTSGKAQETKDTAVGEAKNVGQTAAQAGSQVASVATDQAKEVAQETQRQAGAQVDYMFGTMIEVPRAALTSEEIAREASFFSFGTNDLTQMTFGMSRDDAGSFLPVYIREEIYKEDPTVSIDQTGVGKLMRI